MTIDVRTSVWLGRDPWLHDAAFDRGSDRVLDAGPAAHAGAMHCVQGSLVLGYRSIHLGVEIPLRHVAAYTGEDPDRRIAIAGIDPLSPSLEQDLADAASHRALGVTIAPADQACRPTHDQCMRVFEWCTQHSLPVIVSNPGLTSPKSVLDFARPALLDTAAREYPDLRLVIGELGVIGLDEALLMLAKHEHVYGELSWLIGSPARLYRALREVHDRNIVDKMLFGSGFPMHLPETAIARLYGVNANAGAPPEARVPREAIRIVVERNPLERLGIEHPLAHLPESPEPVVRRRLPSAETAA